MTVIGIDDTDSRERGMCTTYVAATLAERLPSVSRTLLVRLNPAVEYKTRGNAALAIHTGAAPDVARPFVTDVLGLAAHEDPRTNPGAVVADCSPGAIPPAIAAFADDALHEIHAVADAEALIDQCGFESIAAGNGRGVVGALSAVGAWRAHDDWTYECIAYREQAAWGTAREVDEESICTAAEADYPEVWDTVDRATGYPVCVPRTPCPILHGIRGDDRDAVERASRSIEGESVAKRHTFRTNQGTDAHLREVPLDELADGESMDGGSYRVTGAVVTAPETREGGHVFLEIGDDTDGDATIACAAFEPTKRFRDRVRDLREGDRITACGELTDGTLKLEKFAVRELVTTARTTPPCPDCGDRMESAGRDQGYRCRDCGTERAEKAVVTVDRELEDGWYEVPPVARRHIAKPLVRGGFDAPVHPER